MLTVRSSTIEAFRRTTLYEGEGELIESIRRGQTDGGEENEKMRAGTAWHRALRGETADHTLDLGKDFNIEDRHLEQFGDFQFRSIDIDQAIAYTGLGLCEVPARKVFSVGGREVALYGTCDHVRGLVIADHKTRFSAPDPRDYEHSLQWRNYLLLHNAAVFIFHLWHMSEPDKNGLCILKDEESFKFWPYPGMRDDVCYWLHRFLLWCDGRRLTHYLERKES